MYARLRVLKFTALRSNLPARLVDRWWKTYKFGFDEPKEVRYFT
jgi:hypothetical protein